MNNHYVLGFVFDVTGETVLLQRSAHPNFKDQWNGIGGKLEHGEEPLEAMNRESKEEIDFVPVGEWDFKFTFTCLDDTVRVFKTEVLLDTLVHLAAPRENRSQETRAWTVKFLPLDGAPNLGWMIPLCLEPANHLKASTIKIRKESK